MFWGICRGDDRIDNLMTPGTMPKNLQLVSAAHLSS